MDNPIWVDSSLAANITNQSYSIANRDNSGFDGNAYQTLNAAIAAASDGDTINIRGGTYAETIEYQVGNETCFYVSKSVTIQSYNNESVTLTYPAGNPPIVDVDDYGPILRLKTGETITLDGLTIIGTRDEGDSPGGQDLDIGVQFEDNTAGATIKNCTFQKWGHAAIKFGATAGAVTIEKNLFQAGGFAGRDHHIYISVGNAAGTIIRHNAFTGAAGYAIHLYDNLPVNVDIYGNVIHANGGTYVPVNGGGILLGGTGHHVYNNTIVSNIGYGGIVFWKSTCTGNVVKNNIIRDNSNDVTMDAAGSNTVGYNNKHTLSGSGYDPGGTDLDVDPQFAGSPLNSWDDYRLTNPGSPMIDAGIDVGAAYIAILDPAQTTNPTPKNQGAARDIGAFTT